LKETEKIEGSETINERVERVEQAFGKLCLLGFTGRT